MAQETMAAGTAGSKGSTRLFNAVTASEGTNEIRNCYSTTNGSKPSSTDLEGSLSHHQYLDMVLTTVPTPQHIHQSSTVTEPRAESSVSGRLYLYRGRQNPIHTEACLLSSLLMADRSSKRDCMTEKETVSPETPGKRPTRSCLHDLGSKLSQLQ